MKERRTVTADTSLTRDVALNGGTIAPLVAADEGFNHQIVDTFASVSQTDP
jgi:hypothetical protein